MAGRGSGQADFGVEEDGACIWCELGANARFKSGEQSRRNRLRRFAGSGGKELAEGAALVERQRGDDAAFAESAASPFCFPGESFTGFSPSRAAWRAPIQWESLSQTTAPRSKGGR